MPQWLASLKQFLSNVPSRALIFGAFILFSIVVQAFKALAKAKQARENKAQAERDALERMRTGRVEGGREWPSDTELSASAGASQAELQDVSQREAAARDAKIEQIKQQRARAAMEARQRAAIEAKQRTSQQANRQANQQANQQATQAASVRVPTPSAPGATKSVRLPGGIVLEVPTQAQEPRPQRRGEGDLSPKQRAQLEARARALREREEFNRAQRQREQAPHCAEEELGSYTHKLVPDVVTPQKAQSLRSAATASRMAALAIPRDGVSLRRAIILSEVLGPPKSLRQDASH